MFYSLSQMCVALRYFATGGNYRSIGDHHGVSKSSVSRIVDEVVQFLISLSREIIKWPRTLDEQMANAQLFYRKYGKPCTIGVIDGTHISIIRPTPDRENAFFNRKMYHSLNVLVIVLIIIHHYLLRKTFTPLFIYYLDYVIFYATILIFLVSVSGQCRR